MLAELGTPSHQRAMLLPLFLLRASAAHLYDDTQDRAACRFVLFKHVQKTGGRTLVAWLAQLPWVTYVPGSVAAALPRDSQVHPNSLRDFLQPYVQPTTQTLSAGELFKYFFQRLGTGGFASLGHIP